MSYTNPGKAEKTMSFREILEKLDQEEKLKTAKGEFSPEYEIAQKLQETKEPVLFEKVEGSEYEVAGNLLGSRKRIADALGTSRDKLIEVMRKVSSKRKKPKETSEAPVQEVIEEETDLRKLPILKHFEKDGGPYVTSSILVAEDSDGIQNLSFHRMQLIGKNRLAVRLVPRDLRKMFDEAEEKGNSLDVAAIIGTGPALALAAATSKDYEVNEYEIAGALSDELKLTDCKSVPLEIPSNAEIILEGELVAGERASEGPFADITGTYDAVREQPVFEVNCITHREDPIYQALLPASREHQLLMGLPREPLIFENVDEIVDLEDMALTPGGCGWLHGVVSIKKCKDEEVEKAIEAIYEAHSSLKHLVVVDEDIDIYNAEEVEWAIATRFRGDEDLYIKSEVEGSSLDPTADPETRLGCKTALDATKDLEDSKKFEKARIPDKN